MSEICRKDLLSRNLNRMRKIFPADYDYFPATWVLPAEYVQLCALAFTPRCVPESIHCIALPCVLGYGFTRIHTQTRTHSLTLRTLLSLLLMLVMLLLLLATTVLVCCTICSSGLVLSISHAALQLR